MQKYIIVNFDKKEFIVPEWFDNAEPGLACISCNISFPYRVLLNKLADEWRGDQVLLIGENAAQGAFTGSCGEVVNHLCNSLGTNNLYYSITSNFVNVSYERFDRTHYPPDTSMSENCYVYNHATKQMIDLDAVQLDWFWYDGKRGFGRVGITSPLPLLLAAGNGDAEGDFHGRGVELVGSWCDTARSIEVRRTAIPVCDYLDLSNKFSWLSQEDEEKAAEEGLSVSAARAWLVDNRSALLRKMYLEAKEDPDTLFCEIPQDKWGQYEAKAKNADNAEIFCYEVLRTFVPSSLQEDVETFHYRPVLVSTDKFKALTAAQEKLRQVVELDKWLSRLLPKHGELEQDYAEAEIKAVEKGYEGNCLSENLARIHLPDTGLYVEAKVEQVDSRTI